MLRLRIYLDTSVFGGYRDDEFQEHSNALLAMARRGEITILVSRADMIVSWSFKHIVHYDKMRGFDEVNRRAGYTPIEIHSPLEVV